MAEVLATGVDEAELQYLVRMAAAASAAQNNTTFSGRSKNGVEFGINSGFVSIIHGAGEDTGKLALL